MQHAPTYLYLWLAYHVIFLVSYIIRKRNGLKGYTQDENGAISYTPLYYYSRRLFIVMSISLGVYIIVIKWTLGWRIDNWWLEGLLVFFTFCLGHIVFIICRVTFEDGYSRLRVPYLVVAIGFILSFYARLILAVLGGFSYNAHSSASFLPDVRHHNLYLLKDYYLCYSEVKGIVIEKKVFIFSRDISNPHQLRMSFCELPVYYFSEEGTNPADDPFPYVARGNGSVQLQLNPSHSPKGYVNFMINKDSLEITGYKSEIASDMLTLKYVPCGTYRVK